MKIPLGVAVAVEEALALLPGTMSSMKARVMLYAIGLQESRFAYRYQVVQDRPGAKGPARGFWQFERGGGVMGVLRHPSTDQHAERICELRNVPFNGQAVWERIETDDVLAATFARLLLWADANPLPDMTDTWGAWDCYLRNWRPGKPHRSTWAGFHAEALRFVDRRAEVR